MALSDACVGWNNNALVTTKGFRDVLHNEIVKTLGLDSTEAAAAGVIEVADELMANAARVHEIELGKNTAEFDLLVSGGGGALHRQCRHAAPANSSSSFRRLMYDN